MLKLTITTIRTSLRQLFLLAEFAYSVFMDVFMALIGYVITFIFAIYLLATHQVAAAYLWVTLAIYLFCIMGISIGHHRFATHHAVTLHPVAKFIILLAGACALEGRVDTWRAIHIEHHKHSDTDLDPHSAKKGMLYAHMFWILKVPRQYFIDKTTQYNQTEFVRNDKLLQFFANHYYHIAFIRIILTYLIGGWQGLLWWWCVPSFLVLHATWAVNSICHYFGGRDFKTKGMDNSRNNLIVALLTFGEGWHNNHHAFPKSARHGFKWWQIDISWYIICLLCKLKLAAHPYVPKLDSDSSQLKREIGHEQKNIIDGL